MNERALRCVLALAAALTFPASVRGVEQGISFSGDLAYAFPAYGQTVPVDSEVIARLVYDSQAVAKYNLDGCDCATYRQQISHGFSVSFGPMVVRADEYDIHVINDFGPDGGTDFIRIVFSSNQNPSFAAPLTVDGVPQAEGLLVVSLKDVSGTALDGSLLPDPAAFSGFASREAMLKESSAQPAYDLVANLNPPEPWAPVSGDFDFDADVDGSDFLVWQRSVGATNPSPADGDRNGLVDAADLSVWREHFGEAAEEPSTATTIPEPAAVALAMPLFALGTIVRRAGFAGGAGRLRR